MSQPAGPRRPICVPLTALIPLSLFIPSPSPWAWLSARGPLGDRDLVPEGQPCLAAKGLCVPGACVQDPLAHPHGPHHGQLFTGPCPALLLCPGALLARQCWGSRKEWLPWDLWVSSRAVHGGHIPGSRDCPHGSPLHMGAGGCWLCPPRAAPIKGRTLGLPGPRLSIPAGRGAAMGAGASGAGWQLAG